MIKSLLGDKISKKQMLLNSVLSFSGTEHVRYMQKIQFSSRKYVVFRIASTVLENVNFTM